MYSMVRLHGRGCAYKKRNLPSLVKRRYRTDEATSHPKASKDIEATVSLASKSQNPLHLWQRLGPLTKVFNGYGHAQNTRPYATQVVTSVVIYFCGDLGAQMIEGNSYDPRRAARNMVIGATVSIPAYTWYGEPIF